MKGSTLYSSTIMCPHCDSLSEVETSSVDVVMLKCHGCGRAIVCIGVAVFTLDHSKAESIFNTLGSEICGQVTYRDMSTRYYSRPPISNKDIEELQAYLNREGNDDF